jgi:hypothetical protein
MQESVANHSNRLYHFLRAEHAVQAIEDGRLKVTRLAELNAPFDLTTAIAGLPDDTPQETIDRLERLAIERLNPDVGMVCFCTTVADPAVWTHYAQRHSGIALGFERRSINDPAKMIPDFIDMSYPDSGLRPLINLAEWSQMPHLEKFTKALSAFGRKARSWQYENECRIFVCLRTQCVPRGGMYWYPIPKDLLVEVVVGIRCPLEVAYVKRILADKGFSRAEVKRAKASRTRYEVEI